MTERYTYLECSFYNATLGIYKTVVKLVAPLRNAGISPFHHIACHPTKSVVICSKFHLRCLFSSPLCCKYCCCKVIR